MQPFSFIICRPLSMYRLAYNGDVVAFKMGRSARRSEPDWRWESAYLNRYFNRRATQPSAHFQSTQPSGPRPVGCFFRVSRSPRISPSSYLTDPSLSYTVHHRAAFPRQYLYFLPEPQARTVALEIADGNFGGPGFEPLNGTKPR
jgi:hypothetical protein